MPLREVIPMLEVRDVGATVAFYRDRLGFQCLKQLDGWATVERDGTELMLSVPNASRVFEGSKFTGSFYFRVSGVDALWDEMKDKATVVYPIETFNYQMREFAVADNNGYVLQFGEEIEERT